MKFSFIKKLTKHMSYPENMVLQTKVNIFKYSNIIRSCEFLYQVRSKAVLLRKRNTQSFFGLKALSSVLPKFRPVCPIKDIEHCGCPVASPPSFLKTGTIIGCNPRWELQHHQRSWSSTWWKGVAMSSVNTSDIYIYIYMGLVAGGPEIAPKLTWTSSIGPLVIESKNG